MTVKAFILIDTSPGKAKEVAQKLRGVSGVIYAHTVTGPHDIIALVESADVSSLGELVVHRIQSVAGVNRSLDLDRRRLRPPGFGRRLREGWPERIGMRRGRRVS